MTRTRKQRRKLTAQYRNKQNKRFHKLYPKEYYTDPLAMLFVIVLAIYGFLVCLLSCLGLFA